MPWAVVTVTSWAVVGTAPPTARVRIVIEVPSAEMLCTISLVGPIVTEAGVEKFAPKIVTVSLPATEP